MSEKVLDDRGHFEGWQPRECGEHRTVGTHRAWCYDCHEWCYSHDISMACVRCERPVMEKLLDDMADVLNGMVMGVKSATGVDLEHTTGLVAVMERYRAYKEAR